MISEPDFNAAYTTRVPWLSPAMMRLRRALEETVIEGVKTTIPLHRALLNEPDIQNGDYTIKWLEEWLAKS